MSRKYKFYNKEGLYFVSFATVYWLDACLPFGWYLQETIRKYSSAIDYSGGKGLLKIDYI